MITLVVGTRNRHKLEEIRAIAGGGYRLLSVADFSGVPEGKEDAATFAGNATKKAVEVARWLSRGQAMGSGERMWVLADDSGLEVDALDGAPGVHSARFSALGRGRSGISPDAAICA